MSNAKVRVVISVKLSKGRVGKSNIPAIWNESWLARPSLKQHEVEKSKIPLVCEKLAIRHNLEMMAIT